MAENTTVAPFDMPVPSSTGEPKHGATNIQELAERVTAYLKERLTLVTEHGSSFTAASGELIKSTAAITVTLPAPSANAVVELLSNGHEVKLGAGSALIYGDFITGSTPLTFLGYQHIRVVSDGTNWFITAGEPKREAKWSAKASRTEKTLYPVSATRPAYVSLMIKCPSLAPIIEAQVIVGGVEITHIAMIGESAERTWPFSFPIGPGQEWELATTSTGWEIEESHLIE